ncbi:PLP-dependent aminotransferase family protein [Microbispora bryophytorum]|uniref:hypothetical protein n=1 Tax=Microbispora bryophytorum TaxID=1460882 RepID=UPI0027E45D4F|nr:hypothetical protein [Microbispora bryophytorum]
MRDNVLNGDDARLRGGLQFIADKNLPSLAVLAALGSVLNGKYAEGYPGHRYDRGGEMADRAEQIAVERPSGCSGQIMPPCSPTAAPRPSWRRTRPFYGRGTPSLAPERGGHITRGSKVNFSGRWFHVVSDDRDLREQDRHALRDHPGHGRGGNEGDRVSRRPGHPAAGCDNVDPRTGKGADRDASGISPSGIGRSMSFACHN